MEPKRKLVENGCLKKGSEAFIQYLLDMGYTEKSLENYKWIMRCVDQFMHERDLTEYSSDVGRAYLLEAVESRRHTSSVLKVMRCVVRRFDCFMEQGDFIQVMPNISQECPPQFADILDVYLNHMRKRGLRESTIEQRRKNILKALLKFDAAGIQCFSQIRPDVIYDAFEKTSNKQSFCDSVRGLLHYLFEAGVIEFDYSVFVPSFRRNRPIPSVYTAAETTMLLDSIEASATSAKRNNAIILLALRLGMRSGDIANLKISDVDYNSKIISFIQDKTRVPQRLELLPEIEDALLSYISTARPTIDIPNVFLSIKSPVRAINPRAVHGVVSRRLKKAGIDTGERERGGHALRMTLASELVAERIPYDAVRKILGHEDPDVIKHYVKFDIESLRSCAIEIPPVTGKLAAYMGTRLGGESQ